MIKIFYKKKCIIFDSCAERYDPKEVICFNGEQQILCVKSVIAKLEYLERVVILFEEEEECFNLFVQQFVCLEAAGGVVKNEKGDILMIYRNGLWDMPKGKLEQGEDIESCAVREVVEECGIEDITVEQLRIKTFHIYPTSGVWHLKQTWWYDMFSNFRGAFVPQVEEGITDVVWIDSQQLDSKLEKSYSTINEILKGDSENHSNPIKF